jgi:two-component sensor histidine kinase
MNPETTRELVDREAFAATLTGSFEDFGAERLRFESLQKAILNIAEDAEAEALRLQDTQKALLNILEDLGAEKALLQKTQEDLIRSEQITRISLREKEVLLREIHHRVKNNLQVISSLLNLQAHALTDPAAREIFNESQNRVQSIALVHEKLHQSADLSHVNFEEYTAALLDNLFDTYNAADRGISRSIDVGVQLAIDAAIPCGLIVNELVTNALKHGFPDGCRGTVSVGLHEEMGGLKLVVADDGVGLPLHIDPRKTTSLGLDLVFTFAEQLDAQVEVLRERGTTFLFQFPKVSV